jgi:transposase
LQIGGRQIDDAVAEAFLAELAPAGLEAALKAAEQIASDHDSVLAQFKREVERAGYEHSGPSATLSCGRSRKRAIARGLEAEWEQPAPVEAARAELTRREQERPRALGAEERAAIRSLGSDLKSIWSAPTTSDRDRKESLRALLEEVIIALQRQESRAQLTMRWRGGVITQLDVTVPRFKPMGPRTDEDTISLLRRLAVLYPDEVIAGILNRQGRKPATGGRFTANQVGSLRRYRNIPRLQPPADPPQGELATIRKAAQILGLNTSTIHRWLADGFIAGEQVTPGAPWQIRITDELRARIVEQAPPDYLPMLEATIKLGVSRQTVLQRVKRGELEALLVRQGRRKGLRIKVIDDQPRLL